MANLRYLVGLYARGHRVATCMAAVVGLSAIAGVWGSVNVSMPTADPAGGAPVPIWVYLPMPIAALVVAGLHSEMLAVEETASESLRHARAMHVVVVLVFAMLCLGGALLVTGQPLTAAGAVRNLLFWTGLALISARLWRWSLAWVLPLAALFPFDWFGLEAAGAKPWAWPMLSPDSRTSWVAAAICLTAGAVSHTQSAWRLNSIRRTAWQLARLMRPS